MKNIFFMAVLLICCGCFSEETLEDVQYHEGISSVKKKARGNLVIADGKLTMKDKDGKDIFSVNLADITKSQANVKETHNDWKWSWRGNEMSVYAYFIVNVDDGENINVIRFEAKRKNLDAETYAEKIGAYAERERKKKGEK